MGSAQHSGQVFKFPIFDSRRSAFAIAAALCRADYLDALGREVLAGF